MICAVLLAAGAARRYGAQKLLEPLAGRPVVRWAVEAALAAGVGRVVVVLGREAERVRAALSDLDVDPVLNPAFERGMSGSLHAGIRALPPAAEGVVVLLGDQPTVAGATVRGLIAAWRATGADIVVPSYRGRFGNPVLFAASVFPELLATGGDRGAREVVERDPSRVHRVPFAFPPPPDLDAPADLDLLERHLARGLHAPDSSDATPATRGRD